MTADNSSQFGVLDIALSCSMFLQPALKKHKNYIYPLSNETLEFISDWNLALANVLGRPDFKPYLGHMGRSLLRGVAYSKTFTKKCVDFAEDVQVQSLHYAIRFSESVKFLDEKIAENKDLSFVDFGCGLSPMAPAMQNAHKLSDVYCIDIPPVLDVYGQTTKLMGVASPRGISWDVAQDMAKSHKLDAIVAMGVFPYIDLKEQVKRLNFINKNFSNFMVEIKYNNNKDDEGLVGANVFDRKTFQRLRVSAESTEDLETAVLRNSLRYLHKFISAMPDRRYFLARDRSLFLSR